MMTLILKINSEREAFKKSDNENWMMERYAEYAKFVAISAPWRAHWSLEILLLVTNALTHRNPLEDFSTVESSISSSSERSLSFTNTRQFQDSAEIESFFVENIYNSIPLKQIPLALIEWNDKYSALSLENKMDGKHSFLKTCSGYQYYWPWILQHCGT